MRYWTCFYNGYLLLAGNGVGSRANVQRVYTSIVVIIGAIINADIFGNMAVLIDEINDKAAGFQNKIDTANTSMKNMSIPNDL